MAKGEITLSEYKILVQELGGGGNEEATPAPPSGPGPSAVDRNALTLVSSSVRMGMRTWSVGQFVANNSFQILEHLGRGGMGDVWRAKEQNSGVDVALKRLPLEISGAPFEMDRIRQNFALINGLIHQNIAAARGLSLDPPETYLVLEYVEGVDLRNHRAARSNAAGHMPLAEVLALAEQIAAALDFAHAKKVMHRDIKPANIQVRTSGEIKVLDFGLAAEIQNSMSRVSEAFSSTSGTRTYMAPEQWRGRHQDAATDQYAMAVVLYELLSGNLPFECSDVSVLRECVLNELPPIIEHLSHEQNDVLRTGLAKVSDARFTSCRAFVNALSGAAKHNTLSVVETALNRGIPEQSAPLTSPPGKALPPIVPTRSSVPPPPPPPPPPQTTNRSAIPPPPPPPPGRPQQNQAVTAPGMLQIGTQTGALRPARELYVATPPKVVLREKTFERLTSICSRLALNTYEGQVLILGGPRTGKTVLLACLAKRFQLPSPDNIKIGCASKPAMEFRDVVFENLMQGCWPSGTQGDLTQLKMELSTPFFTAPLHLFDLPGETYMNAFSSFLASDSEAAALRYCVSKASVAVLLVSAYDVFQGKSNAGSAWAACEYSRFLHKQPHHPQMNVVLTGAEEYRREIDAIGGPLKAIEAYQPDLFNLYPTEEFYAHEVSAVGDIVREGDHSVPAPHFRSYGLEGLLEWIILHHVLGCVRIDKRKSFWERLSGK